MVVLSSGKNCNDKASNQLALVMRPQPDPINVKPINQEDSTAGSPSLSKQEKEESRERNKRKSHELIANNGKEEGDGEKERQRARIVNVRSMEPTPDSSSGGDDDEEEEEAIAKRKVQEHQIRMPYDISLWKNHQNLENKQCPLPRKESSSSRKAKKAVDNGEEGGGGGVSSGLCDVPGPLPDLDYVDNMEIQIDENFFENLFQDLSEDED